MFGNICISKSEVRRRFDFAGDDKLSNVWEIQRFWQHAFVHDSQENFLEN